MDRRGFLAALLAWVLAWSGLKLPPRVRAARLAATRGNPLTIQIISPSGEVVGQAKVVGDISRSYLPAFEYHLPVLAKRFRPVDS